LRELFVPSRRLRPLFELLLAGLSKPRPSRSDAAGEGGNKAKPVRTGLRVAYAALAGYPVASALGALPGLAVVMTAMTLDSWQRAVVACSGAVLVAIGWVIAILIPRAICCWWTFHGTSSESARGGPMMAPRPP
jgi:hypothetical protein